MDDAEAALDRAFHALADPTRRAILSVVGEQPRAVGQVADALGLSQQTASHHLRVLRGAELVTSTRDGTRQLYAVRTHGMATPRAYLEDFWPSRLESLKRAAEAARSGSADAGEASGGARG